jgi:2-polyprenyl-3-methyl-5-hydroxy-6-metoxy-1,4-benzoquinol methylase
MPVDNDAHTFVCPSDTSVSPTSKLNEHSDIAHTISPVAELSPYADARRSEMLAFIPDGVKRVLDVGCHLGAFGRAIKDKNGAEVWGVEPDLRTSNIAARWLDRVLIGLFCEELDLPNAYFDVISFNDVLEHMPDPWTALKLAKTKLAKDGCIVVSIPNFRHIENLLHILKERDFEYAPHGIRDKTHLRFFTRKSSFTLFENSGLKIVHIQGINENWWSPSLLRRLAFRLFKNYFEDTKYTQFAIVAVHVD